MNIETRLTGETAVQIGITEINIQESANILEIVMDQRWDWEAHNQILVTNIS